MAESKYESGEGGRVHGLRVGRGVSELGALECHQPPNLAAVFDLLSVASSISLLSPKNFSWEHASFHHFTPSSFSLSFSISSF